MLLIVPGIAFFSSSGGGAQPAAEPTQAHPPIIEPGEVRRFAGIEFVWIPPGNMDLDTPAPSNPASLTEGFWLGKCELTQGHWASIMNTYPSSCNGDDLPVESVSWNDVQELITKLNETESGLFDLPTEEEWEYACRAGTSTLYSFNDAERHIIIDYAWYVRNSESMPHPVGRKQPNPWGLYDMHGNVWELCKESGDPLAGVRRGGGWGNHPWVCQSATSYAVKHHTTSSDLGFRLRRAPTAIPVPPTAQ